MTNIKVTVEYETPTTSKFDALMAEYNAAKQMADETVEYYKPLAEMAEYAKFDAIMEQLKPIKYYAQKIFELSDGKYSVWINAYVTSQERGGYATRTESFQVIYSHATQDIEVRWMGSAFSKERMKKYPGCYCDDGYNILGNWDKWQIYKRLETDAIQQLQRLIAKQKERGQAQIDRLNNITKEN